MKKRKLGHSDVEVGELGLGCMGMSTAYGTPDDPESIATVREALDNGCDLIDSSDAYGAGHNEDLLAEAFKDGYREKAFLITKFGNLGPKGVLGTPEYVAEACEKSLARLKTDVIDLYFIHRIESYGRKWCLASGSSGDQIDVSYLDTIFELYSGYHFGQVIEAA